jgi:hypothetical protein
MAFFGLIIAFVSFYLPLKQIRDLHLEVIDLTGQIEVATKKTNFVTSRIDLAMKQKPSAASVKRAEELASSHPETP